MRFQNPLLHRLSRWAKRWIYNPWYRTTLHAADFPPEVWIENTNICNARCLMCPRDKHTRPQGVMPLPLFEKIVAEIAARGDAVRRVHLHNFGEPLVDKDLAQRVRLAKEKGLRHVYFVTNASLLTEPLAKGLIAAGLDEMKISFYGTDAETYNRTMVGLDFEKTMANVRAFFRLRKEAGTAKPRVVIQYLPQASNAGRVSEFAAIFDGLIDRSLGDSTNVFSLHNFGGGRSPREAARVVCTVCDYPWRTMVILHDGRVVPCCLDYDGKLVVGDVNRQTLAEVWNGPDYTALRADFKRLDYRPHPVCLGCDRIF